MLRSDERGVAGAGGWNGVGGGSDGRRMTIEKIRRDTKNEKVSKFSSLRPSRPSPQSSSFFGSKGFFCCATCLGGVKPSSFWMLGLSPALQTTYT